MMMSADFVSDGLDNDQSFTQALLPTAVFPPKNPVF